MPGLGEGDGIPDHSEKPTPASGMVFAGLATIGIVAIVWIAVLTLWRN